MPIAEHLRQLERSRTQALVARDMPLAWRLHAPGYQLITPLGVPIGRDRYLGMIEAGELRYLSWQAEGEIAVRVSETMALLRYITLLEVDAGQGQGTLLRCWHTDSYERISGADWQAVWSQATAIKA